MRRLFFAVLMTTISVSVQAHDVNSYHSATHMIETVHKQLDSKMELDEEFARKALDARPDSIGFFQSSLFPVRSHYPTSELADMAEEILSIIEYSWTRQVLQMGFKAPPPDCGNGGTDDLDIYIQTLPAGIGGFAAFSCYLDDTPEADAASFIVLADNVPAGFLNGAVTHEFNHVLQNAIDYWETITFKENTATWVMDRVYDDENAYFNYLRSYQRNPDWPIHKFSTTNTYQYGECILLHFLSEYYGGGDHSIIVDLWNNSAQNELNNEPDYIDTLKSLIPEVSMNRDSFHDALREYSVWRTITGVRDDGGHFHDGALWPGGANLVPEATLDLEIAELPVMVQSENEPYDYGFNYIRLINPGLFEGAFTIDFQGDPLVEWAVTLIQSRDGNSRHITRSMPLENNSGQLLVNPGMLDSTDDLTIAIVNLANEDFDADTGEDGLRRSYSIQLNPASPKTTLQIWLDQPMTCPDETYRFFAEMEHHGPTIDMDFWLFLEISGEFFSLFTDNQGVPEPLIVNLQNNQVNLLEVLEFTMPDLSIPVYLTWHSALINGSTVFDYQVLGDNLVLTCR